MDYGTRHGIPYAVWIARGYHSEDLSPKGGTVITTNAPLVSTERQSRLSTLWIFVLLNVLFRDVHELFRPGFLQEIMAGTVSEELLLLAGVLLEIPIAMVVLSRVLRYRLNRWANVIAGVATIAFVLSNGANDLDDVFFLAVEIVALLAIVWYAWTWSERGGSQG